LQVYRQRQRDGEFAEKNKVCNEIDRREIDSFVPTPGPATVQWRYIECWCCGGGGGGGGCWLMVDGNLLVMNVCGVSCPVGCCLLVASVASVASVAVTQIKANVMYVATQLTTTDDQNSQHKRDKWSKKHNNTDLIGLPDVRMAVLQAFYSFPGASLKTIQDVSIADVSS
jgi:hypothetical protein